MTPPPPSTPTPYQPPLTLQTIQHVALSSKSYRIFGLADEAWLNARNDLKKQRLVVGRKSSHDDGSDNINDVGNVDNDNTNGGGKEDNTNNYNEEEREEMMEICEAIRTALQEDAGGFGTAGFHLVSLFVVVVVDNISSYCFFGVVIIGLILCCVPCSEYTHLVHRPTNSLTLYLILQ